MEEKLIEIEDMYSNICDCCKELNILIGESETLGERAGLRYRLAMLNAKKETLETCLVILKK